MKKLLFIPLALALLLVGAAVAHAVTAVVTPADLTLDPGGWYFWDDVNDVPSTAEVPGDFEMVVGPDAPPVGFGSVEMTVSGSERWNIATYQYAGTALPGIAALGFSTYQPSSNPGSDQRAVFLNFDVDFDNTDVLAGSTGYQGRLVYVPRQNGVVMQNTWQNWDALDGGDALWWWSRYAANGNTWLDGSTDEYRTWSDIVASFPNAEVLNESFPGQLLLRAGEPYADGFTGNVDAVVVNDTTWDFEVGDSDGDGVDDAVDICLGTEADTAAGGAPYDDLKPNRWVWDGDDWKQGEGKKGNANNKDFEIEDTRGCGCDQILDRLEEGTGLDFDGHRKFGCSQSLLEDWMSGWYSLDSVMVSPHNDEAAYPAPTLTNVMLHAGENYKFVASGVWRRTINGGDGFNYFDAQYSSKNPGYTWGENGDADNGDLRVNDVGNLWGPLDEVGHAYELLYSPGADEFTEFYIWMNDVAKYPGNLDEPLTVNTFLELY